MLLRKRAEEMIDLMEKTKAHYSKEPHTFQVCSFILYMYLIFYRFTYIIDRSKEAEL